MQQIDSDFQLISVSGCRELDVTLRRMLWDSLINRPVAECVFSIEEHFAWSLK